MYEIYGKLPENIANYQREGSSCIQNGVLRYKVNVSKYTLLRGLSYIDLPEPIKTSNVALNVSCGLY